jgi:acyl dehydratase
VVAFGAVAAVVEGLGTVSDRRDRPEAPDESTTQYGDWGPTVRVRIEHSAAWAFARAVKDENPVYSSAAAAASHELSGVPVPPTFSFAWLHGCALPDLQPEGSVSSMLPPGADLFGTGGSARGIYLHGEQTFAFHRQPRVGDLLEGRMRVSEPVEKSARRGKIVLTRVQTRWSTPDGAPVVTEEATFILVPEA